MAITKSYKRRRGLVISKLLRTEINKLQITQDMPVIIKWLSKNLHDIYRHPDKFIHGENQVMDICGHKLRHCELIKERCGYHYRYTIFAFPVEYNDVPSYLDSFGVTCPIPLSGPDHGLLAFGRLVKRRHIALV